MTTRLLLLRHLPHTEQDRILVGRRPGVALAPVAPATQEALIRRVADHGPPVAIQSSPLDRARATAEPIAQALGLPVEVAPALDEIDYGAWTGRTIAELDPDPLWRRWNHFRGGTRPPGGESMTEVQHRAWAYALGLRDRYPGGNLLLVSHGDVIRALLLQALGMPLELIFRLEVAPGSLSALELDEWGTRLAFANLT